MITHRTHARLLAAGAVCAALVAGLTATASQRPDAAAPDLRPVEVRPLPDVPPAAYEALRARALRAPAGDVDELTPATSPAVASPRR